MSTKHHQVSPKPVENTTDATRGEPLALRAEKRRAELELALVKIPAKESRTRSDIEIALGALNELLTGDVEHLSHVTAAEINRWLENTKHLAEVTPIAKRRHAKN